MKVRTLILQCLKIILAPLLIIQGRQIRAGTPRLEEAPGPRKGRHGQGEAKLRLLIVGDSAAAGCGLAHQSHALSCQVLDCFDSNWQLEWELKARSGLTTSQVLEMLRASPPRTVDAVVTSLGVNDVKNGIALAQWRRDQQALIRILTKKFKARYILLSAVPPMEKFPAHKPPLAWYLGLGAHFFNQTLAHLIRIQDPAGPQCRFIQPELPLDPKAMAADGFHPGPAIHRAWAQQIHRALLDLL